MLYNDTPPPGGDASPADCACDPVTADGTDTHDERCTLFDRSRDRRERDLAVLLGRPDGTAFVRPVDTTELGDLAAAVGRTVRGRTALRHWRVRVSAAQQDGTLHIARVFLRDGRPVGALIDSVRVPAGSAS